MHIYRERDQFLVRGTSPVYHVALRTTAAAAAEETDRYVNQVDHAYARGRLWRLRVCRKTETTNPYESGRIVNRSKGAFQFDSWESRPLYSSSACHEGTTNGWFANKAPMPCN